MLNLVAWAQAKEFTAGALTVVDPWARASVGAVAGAFLTIRNDGEADRLVGASSEIASEAMLHESRMEGGVMEMRHVDAIVVPAHGQISLKPGGYHLMLMGLKTPLKAGDTFPLTLVFEKGGAVRVTAAVEALGSMGPGR